VYAYAYDDPPTWVDPSGLWAAGPEVGIGGEIGIPGLGAGINASAGGGMFWGGPQGPNFGGFVGGGGYYGGPDSGSGYPGGAGGAGGYSGGPMRWTLSGGASVGIGGFLTNADTPGQLAGPFHALNVYTPWGTGQIAWSGKTWITQIMPLGSTPTLGVSYYPTTTWSPGSVGRGGRYIPGGWRWTRCRL
jgi:hypothetical protein